MIKDVFDISFADEDAESDKSKEKATSQKKKKSKIDKKLTKDFNFSEQEHISKKAASKFRDHLDNSRLKSQILKKQQCHTCSEFHFYKKCYYFFSDLISEA